MNVPGSGNTPDLETVEVQPDDGVVTAEDLLSRGGNDNGNGAGQQAVLPEIVDEQEIKATVEALLFVCPEPLPLERMLLALTEVPRADVERALRALQADYAQGRGFQLVEVGGGFRFVTRPDYAPWVKRLDKVRPAAKLSRSALETLAIIAYRQPVVRAEIEQIRGVETSSVLRTLLERKLVRMVGRKEVPGRPIMYGPTKLFLEHFGLRDLSDLPPLREFKELGEPDQANLPIGQDPIVIPKDAGDTALEQSEGEPVSTGSQSQPSMD